MGRYLQFRAFIGPKWVSDATFWQYYLSMPAIGFDLDIDYQTAVLTSLVSGATSLVTTNDSTLYNKFATAGGLWVGPNGGGQGWEYVGYTGRTTNTFSGLVRESSTYRQHNGAHSAGAEVRLWYPIESDSGELELRDQLTTDFSARYWSADINGFVLPPSLLRNNHLVTVVYRTSPADSWKFMFLGLSNAVQIHDDYQRTGKWTLHVTSLQSLCENTMVHGLHIGDLDVAQFGEATGSAPLGSAFKELTSGDYSGAAPDFSAASIIDGDPETLFIGDYVTGTQISVDHDYDFVTQLHLNPHPGRGPAYKWIEMTNFSTDGSVLKAYNPIDDYDITLDFSDFSVESGDYRIILTDDEVTFVRENPAHGADKIVELADVGVGQDFLKHCKASGGAIGKEGMGGFTNVVAWGTIDIGALHDHWDITSTDWRGDAIPAPGYGQTIALKHDYVLGGTEDDKNKWAVRDYGTPGYMPRPDHPENSWVAVILPGLGLSLRDDITSADTVLYLVDTSGEPSTEGLPASGTIQIGVEQITYTGKAVDSLTGCTVTVSHDAGDLIYVIENGIATDGYPLTDVVLKRFGGSVYLLDYIFRYSRVLGRMPNMSDHDQDYASPYGGSFHKTDGSTAEQVLPFSVLAGSTVRCRTLIVEFRKMTTDPARGRLNSLEALADISLFSADYFVESPANCGDVIWRMLKACSVPPGAVSYGGVTTELERTQRTAREWAWTAITDFADMTGCFVNFTRDSHIWISDNDFYTTAVGGYTADYNWDEDDVVYVDSVTRAGDGVGQVRLAWQSADGSTTGTAVYPATVGARLSFEDIGPYVFEDNAAATLAARKRYFLKRSPYYVVVEMVDVNQGIAPGQFFRLSWTFPGDPSAHNRLYIVAGVDIRIENELAVQVVTGILIDREVEW